MKDFNELEPWQEELIPGIRDKWEKVMLNTGPMDLEKCREIIPQIYEAAKQPPPKYYVAARSPWEGLLIAAMALQLYKQPDRKEWEAIMSEINKDPRSGYDRLDRWRQEKGYEMKDLPVRGRLEEQCYGAYDAGWLAVFDFLEQIKDIEPDHALKPQQGLAKACGWWAPYDETVILQDWPDEIHLQGTDLHNEEGPAVAYSDGYKIWVIEGVHVDEQIVMAPETQTIAQIQGEENDEVRRIRTERFGWARYIREADGKLLDVRLNNIELVVEALFDVDSGSKVLLTNLEEGLLGEFAEKSSFDLSQALADADEVFGGYDEAATTAEAAERLMKYQARERRSYALQVGDEVKTCKEAQNWLWNRDDVEQVVVGRT